MTARADLGGIKRVVWEECLEASGRVFLLRGAADLLKRGLRISARLDRVLRAEALDGPLPWPFNLLAKENRRRRHNYAVQLKASQSRLQGTERHRGRETRMSLFVRQMFERDPALTRSPGSWIRACDEYGSPEADPYASTEERRAVWKHVLRRRAASLPSSRRRRG